MRRLNPISPNRSPSFADHPANQLRLLLPMDSLGRRWSFPVRCRFVAESPNIGSNCRCLSIGQVRSTHRRHRTAELFRSGHTFGDHLENSSQAPITPQVFLFREIRTEKRPGAICTVASRAGCAAYLAVENPLSQ